MPPPASANVVKLDRAPADQPQGTPEQGDSLYAKHEKVYPKSLKGRFRRLRTLSTCVLLGIFYVGPWIPWQGKQAILLDLPAREFHIFGLTLWPQDFIFLTGMMVIGALSLFFFTALAGRLWCGYACPQTVWTDSFLWMERWVEGDRNKRMRLDKSPMSARKFRIKATKHSVWLLFSLFTGFSFVAYFTPAMELTGKVASLNLGGWEVFWILFYGFATYGNAGFMREQVCKYMCPYARFQSAMFDDDTLIVSYDAGRGEPRGKHARDVNAEGSCIDCRMCVQVCPTGIDIREGLQYECIGCSACIDACDAMMDKIGQPKGLIHYTTQNEMDGKASRVIRPRIIVYSIILMTVMALVGTGLVTRVPLELDVIRDRNSLYRDTGDGHLENVYTLKLLNKDGADHQYQLHVSGVRGMELYGVDSTVKVPSGDVVTLPVRVKINYDELAKQSTPILFHLQATDAALSVQEEARFLGPAELGR